MIIYLHCLKSLKIIRTMKKLNLLMAMLLSVAVLVSCKDTKKAKKEEASAPKVEKKEAPKAEEAKDVEIVLEGNDAMQYNKKELVAYAGKKVKLTLKHVGKMPKSAMGHNFILLKKGTDLAKFATEAMKAKDNDYIPSQDHIIAHTKLLGGGEKTTIVFDAPEKGEYDFLCSFPGHYAMMKGKFIVK